MADVFGFRIALADAEFTQIRRRWLKIVEMSDALYHGAILEASMDNLDLDTTLLRSIRARVALKELGIVHINFRVFTERAVNNMLPKYYANPILKYEVMIV